MGPITADTLVISDVHLGSDVSRAREATRLLQIATFRRLILLGDIFCDLNFRRLQKHHWKFLSEIRKLSNPRRDIEVVWVEGNHDRGLSQVMSHLVGVQVYEEYCWEFRGTRFLAVHGHQFDRFLVNNALLSRLGEWIYLQLQRLDSRSNRLSRFLDRQNSRWLRLSPKVCKGALALARERGAGVVICGHTHQPMQAGQNGIRYVNSGCWTSSHVPTYVAISESGISLCEFATQELPAVDEWKHDDGWGHEDEVAYTVSGSGTA
ncbi:MAG: UDP-2,3-diacylglucosamine diphosphatase [Acidobacteria bacterium]|nr:UDP-2,3-diacylglucosamine diphosphatase [Acidobacteriota bacterium]